VTANCQLLHREPLSLMSEYRTSREGLMADNLLGRIGNFLHRRPWYTLPKLLAMPQLVEIRNQLRRENLHDTEEPPLERRDVPDLDPARHDQRTIDGSNNDLQFPAMGSCGRRFGRNVPLEHTFPDQANLFTPSPRVVSRELMTRDQFRPATALNLLAAAWIQFMVHDWFVHKRSSLDDGVEIPLAPGDDWSDAKMRVPRSVPDPAPAGSTRPPAYANPNSHWWDGSQVYGSDDATAAALRTGEGGRLKIEATGLLAVDPATGLNLAGFHDNWWIGLAMLHTLFTREHNHVCDTLAAQHPDWNDAQLHAKAKLINSALMAKIHTLEWTVAIVPHPVIEIAMNTNWNGIAGEDLQQVFKFLNDDEILGGIVGSKADQFGAPYSLTEEFVAVYRMHPLMPDELALKALATGALVETIALPDMAGVKTPGVAARIGMPNLFYSFGVAHPGAITLHNYPKHLQNLTRDDGEHLDLAAVDIFRDRERGVPRYNQFRRLLHKEPVGSFEELTDNPAWREEIRKVYDNDLEKVDLMTGLFAEPLPEGFGFSETAFRVFVLMASRRLKSDRFFTDDFRPELYTEFGLKYIRETTMLTVLQRHYPELAPSLQGVTNAFKPWRTVGSS
jgi:Animal haem peroxidase